MLIETACESLKTNRRLELRYHDFVRVVEVHAVGYSKAGNPVARVWQVRGDSSGADRVGWKLLRLDEGSGGSILDEASSAPRPGYKSGDRTMTTIICEV